MIDLKLKTFIQVVELKSFTQAAQCLHLTQPAVTQHVKQLENHYQHKLIKNTHKEFQLTKAGEQLYKYAKIQTHNEDIFESQLDRVHLPLKLGATLSIADYYLPQFIAHYLSTTNQKTSIIVNNTQTLTKMMVDGNLDCAFVEGQFDSNLFDYHLFKEEKFILVANQNHPLHSKKITLSDLFSYPLFMREEGSGTRKIFENYLLQSIYTLDSFNKAIEVQSLTMIKKLILNTDGISFLYEAVVKNELLSGELVQLDLDDFNLIRPMYFIYLHHSINKDIYVELFNQIKKEESLLPIID